MFRKSSYTQTSISEWKTKYYNECANEKYETENIFINFINHILTFTLDEVG